MSKLMFWSVSAHLHEQYGRPSTALEEIFRQPGEPAPQSQAPDRDSSMAIQVRPDTDTRVQLSTGESFREMKGVVTLKPSDEARPIASSDKSRNQIGFMQYFEGMADEVIGTIKPSYSIWALIPRPQFNDLVAALQKGGMPAKIWVDVEGLELPDEFSATWDTKAKKGLPMVSINFSIPLVNHPEIDADDEEERTWVMPVNRADLKVLFDKALVQLQKADTKLAWLLAGMAALVVLIFLRRW